MMQALTFLPHDLLVRILVKRRSVTTLAGYKRDVWALQPPHELCCSSTRFLLRA